MIDQYIGLFLFFHGYIIYELEDKKINMMKNFCSFNISCNFFCLKFEQRSYDFDIEGLSNLSKNDSIDDIKLRNKLILMNTENLYCNGFLRTDFFSVTKFFNIYIKNIYKIFFKLNNFFSSYFFLKEFIIYISSILYLPEMVHIYIYLINIILTSGKERIEILTQEELFFENLNNEFNMFEKKKFDRSFL